VVRAVLLVQLISAVDGEDLTGVGGGDGNPPTPAAATGGDGIAVAGNKDEQVPSGPRAWAWLLYEEWIPATLPALCLLYLMRDARNAGPEAMRASSSFTSTSSGNANSNGNGIHYGRDVEMAARGSTSQPSSAGQGGSAMSQPPKKGHLPGQYQLIDEATY